jgi:retron-type reverse transcriptase
MTDLLKKLIIIPNLEAAWQRVLANGGCRGSDGISLQRFGFDLIDNLRDLSHSLEHGYYHPYPLLRFPVPKKSSHQLSVVSDQSSVNSGQLNTDHGSLITDHRSLKTAHRFLSVPTVGDRVAQTAAFLVTKKIFEAEFEDVSHAYRQGRGVRTAVWDIKEWRDKGYRFAVDADITSYFDNVPHDILLGKLQKLIPDPAILRLFEKWIKAEVYDGQKIWTLDKGIPQGSVVSPPLANLLLDELDETLMSFKMKLVRYADDFLILTKTEKAAQDAIELTDMMLEDLQLDLNPLKTKIVHFDKGFKFLGAIFLHDGIFLPFPQKRDKEHPPPKLPPALTLRRYLELRNKS